MLAFHLPRSGSALHFLFLNCGGSAEKDVWTFATAPILLGLSWALHYAGIVSQSIVSHEMTMVVHYHQDRGRKNKKDGGSVASTLNPSTGIRQLLFHPSVELGRTTAVACRSIYDCLITIVRQTENEVAQELQASNFDACSPSSSKKESSDRGVALAQWLQGPRAVCVSVSRWQMHNGKPVETPPWETPTGSVGRCGTRGGDEWSGWPLVS